MKKLSLIISALFSHAVMAACSVEITDVKANCDGHGSSCYDYFFDNTDSKDYMACVWDENNKDGYVLCTYADRNYKESFTDVLVGLVTVNEVKQFKTGCLSEAESEKLYQ